MLTAIEGLNINLTIVGQIEKNIISFCQKKKYFSKIMRLLAINL